MIPSFWAPHAWFPHPASGDLTDLVHHTFVCHPLLPPQGVLTALLPEHWAMGKKRFARARNSLREKKGNAECWLLGKSCVSAAVVENAWEAPLTIALCYRLACVHTTKDQPLWRAVVTFMLCSTWPGSPLSCLQSPTDPRSITIALDTFFTFEIL